MLALSSRLGLLNLSRRICHRLVVAQSLSQATGARQASVDTQLQLLDNDVRRRGRVNVKDVTKVFNSVKAQKSATSNQALLLIRCCGTLMAEASPRQRTQLISEIWDTLVKQGVKFDVSHYNALLKVYLDNEQAFNPVEFLDQLATNGIEPNRVTYQRLIHRYAQLGDIAGATKILEFMKSKDMPLNEAVFSFIILGYGKANDLTAARGTIDIMKQAGLEPGSDTFVALLKVFAEKASSDLQQLPAIDDVIQQAQNNDVYLNDEDLLDVIKAIASSDAPHAAEVVDKLLDLTPKSRGFNQDCFNVCVQLINLQKVDMALKVFRSMKLTEPLAAHKSSGMFFVAQLVKAGVPADKVFELCAQFKEEGSNIYGFRKAAEIAIEVADFETTRKYIRRMVSESDDPLNRPHYYWPLLTKSRNDDDVLDLIQNEMKNLSFSASVTSLLDTFTDYIWPRIAGDKMVFMNNCAEAGFSLSMLTSSLALHYIHRDQLKDAAELVHGAKSSNMRLICRTLQTALANSFIRTGDVDQVVAIIKVTLRRAVESAMTNFLLSVQNAFRGPAQNGSIQDDYNGRFLTTVALSEFGKTTGTPLIEQLIKKMHANNIHISKAVSLCFRNTSLE